MQSMYLSAIPCASSRRSRGSPARSSPAEPTSRPVIESIERQVRCGQIYRALREAQRLILREGEATLAKAVAAGN